MSGNRAGATVSSSVLRALFQAAAHHGVDHDELLRAVRVDRRALEEIDGRVPYAALVATWSELARRIADPELGLRFAERFVDSRTFTVVGLAARRCATVGEALELAVRYARVVNEVTDTRLVRRGRATILIDQPLTGGPWPRHHAEASLASYISLGRRWVDGGVRPRRVSFQHPAPADPEAVQRWFGAPVAFGQQHNALELGEEVMAAPLPEPDAELREYLEAKARSVLSTLTPASMLDRVRTALRAELARGASLDAVARRVGLTPRTLQRRLADESVVFQALVEEERCAAGLFALQEEGASVAAAARAAGYQDPKAFRRACKRWIGLAPRDLRKKA